MHCLHRVTRYPRAGLALALIVAAQAGPAWSRTMAEQIVWDVRKEIENGDCQGAVSALNKGLASRYPEVQLLAASLYENGACLKASWRRAENLYLLAYQGGQKMAAYRLAAGAAAPENGPDVATALWWATRAGLRHGSCLPSAAALDDAELFLGEIKTWPESRVAACNYVAGVMSTMVAEVRYPAQAINWTVEGDVIIAFRPAQADIALTLNGTEQRLRTGAYNGDRLWEQNDKAIGSAFVQAVRAVADRALQRYPQPPGIAPEFPEAKVQMRFTMQDARMPQFRD